MDRLQAMQVFTRVVEASSFTKAADNLQLPRATVTNLVQSLEAHLGVSLLHRTTRRVNVTADGAAYYERCWCHVSATFTMRIPICSSRSA
jgi:LysR family transcriptional regulator for bpeEF and oprC